MDTEQLRRVLGKPDLVRLIDRLVSRLERGDPLSGTITIQGASANEREAITRLLGRRASGGSSVSVNLDQLNAIVTGAALATNLREAVESLRGPCIDRKAERRAIERGWSAVWELANARVRQNPALLAWAAALRRDGTLRRFAASEPEVGRELLQRAFEVIEQLPCDRISLAELAARTCGDSHALDLGQRLSSLVLRALAVQRGEPLPDEPAGRRALWERFGVVCDELSAPVLVLNLTGDGVTRLGQILALHAASGEPCRISTRQLLRDNVTFGADLGHLTVYVCENVSVLAAAATRLGPQCPPMICIEGQPKTAACLLLERLGSRGARLLYHGDFDWAGLSIANLLQMRYGIEPWRMSTAEYLASASNGADLGGSPVDALWDGKLRTAMQMAAKVVHEELVLESLLTDFADHGRRPTCRLKIHRGG